MDLVMATKDSEAGILPSTEPLELMGKDDEDPVNAGTLLAGTDLQFLVRGKCAILDGESRTVIGAPFAETSGWVAGYCFWEVTDLAEAVEWVKRFPNPMPGPSEIQFRPVFEATDFGDALTPELAEQEERTRSKATGA